MLQACILDFKKACEKQLRLIEFLYNNSKHSSIEMFPFETLYSRRCITQLCWPEINDTTTIRPELIEAPTQKIRVIQERMKAT